MLSRNEKTVRVGKRQPQELEQLQLQLDTAKWWSDKVAEPSAEDILRYPILDPANDDFDIIDDIVA